MPLNRPMNRRTLIKGVGGLAAASLVGTTAALGGSSPAYAADLGVTEHQTFGRMEYYRLSTPSIGWEPGVNVLLPDGYDPARRYPVYYLLHGGGGNFMDFDVHHDIRGLTAGRDIIVVMPDGGIAGWYSNPVTSFVGPRNWETFHIEELIPWVDATFSTIPEFAGRAVGGFSMGGFGALKYTAKYYGHFASVSSHSGPSDLRGETGQLVTHWANASSAGAELGGGMVYGAPWDEARVSADNPMENLERYRGKRIFLVAGTDVSDINEGRVLPTQQTFGGALDAAGIPHERYEDAGAHFVRRERLQQDIDGVVAHLAKAG